jgi:hypothetical protein
VFENLLAEDGILIDGAMHVGQRFEEGMRFDLRLQQAQRGDSLSTPGLGAAAPFDLKLYPGVDG